MTKAEHLQAAATKLAEADHHLEEAKLAERPAVEGELYQAAAAVGVARHYLGGLLERRKRAGVDEAGS